MEAVFAGVAEATAKTAFEPVLLSISPPQLQFGGEWP